MIIPTFAEKFGTKFDPERVKLLKGMKFTLVQVVEITDSLKKDKDGNTYRIASVNGKKGAQDVKYYISNKAVVNQIEQQVMQDVDNEGFLTEPVDVTVVQKKNAQGQTYLALE
jgi:NADP-dependent 3-hydroxy acid dehydrogenase YdfG